MASSRLTTSTISSVRTPPAAVLTAPAALDGALPTIGPQAHAHAPPDTTPLGSPVLPSPRVTPLVARTPPPVENRAETLVQTQRERNEYLTRLANGKRLLTRMNNAFDELLVREPPYTEADLVAARAQVVQAADTLEHDLQVP